jgi:hypothetical protein
MDALQHNHKYNKQIEVNYLGGVLRANNHRCLSPTRGKKIEVGLDAYDPKILPKLPSKGNFIQFADA